MTTYLPLHRRYARSKSPALKARIAAMHTRMVHQIAFLFAGREPHEDLVMVGTVGLLEAIDRYDPSKGVEFSTYAYRTIHGVINHYLRDQTLWVKIPRRVHDNARAIPLATDKLTVALGRAPTVREIATQIGEDESEVLEAIASAHYAAMISLDTARDTETGPVAMVDFLVSPGGTDAGVEHADLYAAIAMLRLQDRRIIEALYFDDLTQIEAAEALGMHAPNVSRRKGIVLRCLRETMERQRRR